MIDGDSLSLPYSLRIRVGVTFVRASAIAAIRASRVLAETMAARTAARAKARVDALRQGLDRHVEHDGWNRF